MRRSSPTRDTEKVTFRLQDDDKRVMQSVLTLMRPTKPWVTRTDAIRLALRETEAVLKARAEEKALSADAERAA
jgi:hypothetical protein